ncbi:hypothetical protein F982_03775 [Acinetobacter baumannii NIPH 1362]|nr:hypothetical protein F982_03775 [Acinetobacter baumannii NIPH 1362]
MKTMILYNTPNSPQEALHAIKEALPIHLRNEVLAMIMAYHNALVREMKNALSN